MSVVLDTTKNFDLGSNAEKYPVDLLLPLTESKLIQIDPKVPEACGFSFQMGLCPFLRTITPTLMRNEFAYYVLQNLNNKERPVLIGAVHINKETKIMRCWGCPDTANRGLNQYNGCKELVDMAKEYDAHIRATQGLSQSPHPTMAARQMVVDPPVNGPDPVGDGVFNLADVLADLGARTSVDFMRGSMAQYHKRDGKWYWGENNFLHTVSKQKAVDYRDSCKYQNIIGITVNSTATSYLLRWEASKQAPGAANAAAAAAAPVAPPRPAAPLSVASHPSLRPQQQNEHDVKHDRVQPNATAAMPPHVEAVLNFAQRVEAGSAGVQAQAAQMRGRNEAMQQRQAQAEKDEASRRKQEQGTPVRGGSQRPPSGGVVSPINQPDPTGGALAAVLSRMSLQVSENPIRGLSQHVQAMWHLDSKDAQKVARVVRKDMVKQRRMELRSGQYIAVKTNQTFRVEQYAQLSGANKVQSALDKNIIRDVKVSIYWCGGSHFAITETDYLGVAGGQFVSAPNTKDLHKFVANFNELNGPVCTFIELNPKLICKFATTAATSSAIDDTLSDRLWEAMHRAYREIYASGKGQDYDDDADAHLVVQEDRQHAASGSNVAGHRGPPVDGNNYDDMFAQMRGGHR